MSNREQTTAGTPLKRPKGTHVRVRGMTLDGREHVLTELLAALDRAGGWVLDRQTRSAHVLTLWIEMQTRVLVDIYAAIAGSDVLLTRESHQAMAERCNCVRNLGGPAGLSAILTIQFDISFLPGSAWHASWMATCARTDTMM